MTVQEILKYLLEKDRQKVNSLFEKANTTRKESVGNEVYLRGIIEFSNFCNNTCSYCGLNSTRKKIKRYRMSEEEIVSCAEKAVEYGIGTIVLQSGQDQGFSIDWMSSIIYKIKKRYNLAITLSLGERDYYELREWKKAGADRYFLRFETSDDNLYRKLHPGRNTSFMDRLNVLEIARTLGYEIGSGMMIGIPGQTLESIADDIILFKELDLDMIGVGPYIPHPDTELGKEAKLPSQEIDELVCKVIAITRILRPFSNIPATTALATVNFLEGYKKGLMAGANVIMPNITPIRYKRLYDIYPSKLGELTEKRLLSKIKNFIYECGYVLGKGRGDSINFLKRREILSDVSC